MSSGRSHPFWARGVAVVTAVLFAGLPVLAGAGSATEPAPAAAASLSVTSNPAGAAVYVDGKAAGATPVDVTVAPGEHRVRVEKDGYLENSRRVTLAAGEASPLRVSLTPTPQVEEPRPQPTPKPSGGGGSGKKILIGLGVVAVGVGVALAVKGGNKPPTVSGVTVSPSGAAIMGATNVTATANASDPDGDPLTYTWNFGDGGTGSGATASHVYQGAGTFNVSVTVSDGKAQANGTGSVTVRSMAGSWRGSLGGADTTVSLAHSGSTLSGNINIVGLGGSVSGRVSDPRAVTFTSSVPGFIPWTFTGTLDSSGNQLTGVANGSGFSNTTWNLSRQ